MESEYGDEWYYDKDLVLEAVHLLHDNGNFKDMEEMLYFIEKPYKWTDELKEIEKTGEGISWCYKRTMFYNDFIKFLQKIQGDTKFEGEIIKDDDGDIIFRMNAPFKKNIIDGLRLKKQKKRVWNIQRDD